MHYQIITNMNCNLECKYCFEKSKEYKKITDGMISDYLSFIKGDIERHPNEIISINISGGECLLNFPIIKKLVERIELVLINEKRDFIWEISTNTVLITKQSFEFFKRHNFDFFLSLVGIKESHNLNRIFKNGKGSFDKVFSRINYIYKNLSNHKKIIINSVITPNNVKYLSENYLFLTKNFNVKISMNIAFNQNWKEQEISLLEKELYILGEIYSKRVIETKEIGFDFFDKQIKLNLLNNNEETQLCSAGKTTCTILPDGNILSCGDFSGLNCNDVIIGNLIEGLDLKRIELFQKQVSSQNMFSKCSECVFRNKCSNYCPSRNYHSCGKLFEISTQECIISQKLIQIADYILNKISILGKDFIIMRYIN